MKKINHFKVTTMYMEKLYSRSFDNTKEKKRKKQKKNDEESKLKLQIECYIS